MKRKQLFSLVLCLILAAALFPVSAQAEGQNKTLTLREDWRLTSDLDLAVPEGETLTIDGGGQYYIYELPGKLLNSGLGTVTFTNGTILYPAGDSGTCTTATSNALMAERQPHVVTIDAGIVRGTVTATGTGTSTTGTATAAKGENVTLTVTPEENYKLKSLTVTDENGKEIEWTLEEGIYTFPMTVSDVTVSAVFQYSDQTRRVTGVTLNKPSTSLQVGDTETLTATIAPDNAADKDVIWSSSDDTVATVDENGMVTAISAGTASITATTADGGFTASCAVTVTRPDSPGAGGGAINFGIAVTPSEGGTVKPSQTSAPKDAKITLTVTPDEGYRLDKLTVTNSSGEPVAVTDNGDGTWTFTLPAMKVTVEAVFVKEEVEPGPGPGPEPQTRFVDVDEADWFHDAVYHCADNGYFKGVDDTHFDPQGTMTRAMFATVLYRVAGEPAVTGENPFTDVKTGQWYTDAVTWAAGEGIISGYGGGLFGTDDSVTREQMVTIFWRYNDQPAGTGDLSDFKDADTVSDWAKDAFAWAVGAGIISGKGDGILDPAGTGTRAEVAQIVMNYDTKLG